MSTLTALVVAEGVALAGVVGASVAALRISRREVDREIAAARLAQTDTSRRI